MARFIVTISWGDESCCGETYIAVECESIEELYSNLMDAAKRYADFKNAEDPKSFGFNNPMYEANNKLEKELRYPVICGSKFDMNSLIDVDVSEPDNKFKVIDYNFSFETLDEWFRHHKDIINEWL
jgi:hypothetical protein